MGPELPGVRSGSPTTLADSVEAPGLEQKTQCLGPWLAVGGTSGRAVTGDRQQRGDEPCPEEESGLPFSMSIPMVVLRRGRSDRHSGEGHTGFSPFYGKWLNADSRRPRWNDTDSDKGQGGTASGVAGSGRRRLLSGRWLCPLPFRDQSSSPSSQELPLSRRLSQPVGSGGSVPGHGTPC